jgi:hypothetical protein
LINNRQGGRRRGRGGQRPPNVGGQPGNRQDSRQRGNAAQLLEKYKNMARDAQLGGDRVQSEYYLQFAEHYYRVLGESRARFEEQRRQRGDDGSDEDGDDDMLEAADDHGDQNDQGEPFEQQEQAGQREQRDRRPQREFRDQRPRRQDNRANGARPESNNDDEERISLEVLPPSIGREVESGDDDGDPVAAKPRRRARRPRPEGEDDEIAPAA